MDSRPLPQERPPDAGTHPAEPPLDIVCLSSIDWDFVWQGHQQVMAALAAEGHRVLFVENTGVRAPGLRDLPRLRQRLRNWWRGTRGFRQECPRLFVYAPLLLPMPYSRVAREVNRRLLAQAVRRWMAAVDAGRPVLWTFLPTPLARALARDLEPSLVVYYCIDDLPGSSKAARRLARTEPLLMAEADLVFVTSEALRRRALEYRRDVPVFPFAVDFEKFEGARHAPTPLPPELAHLRRPIVGYVGGVHRWLDQDLVASVARALPSWDPLESTCRHASLSIL